MKKMTIALVLLAMVATAHAAYIWNVAWTLGGGYAESPLDSSHAVLDDFSVTWSLFDGDTLITSMPTIAAGTTSFDYYDSTSGNTATYNKWLEQTDGIPTYYGSVDDNNVHKVYQYIYITDGTVAYEWKSGGADVTPTTVKVPADTPAPLSDGPLDIHASDWTPVGQQVPEPATMSLLGLGALAMVLRRKLRK